jgi:hypothetical protein
MRPEISDFLPAPSTMVVFSLSGAAEHIEGDILPLDAEILGDQLTA